MERRSFLGRGLLEAACWIGGGASVLESARLMNDIRRSPTSYSVDRKNYALIIGGLFISGMANARLNAIEDRINRQNRRRNR